MHKYERIVFWSDEDEKFIVEVPELPGCLADGATVSEAIENSEKIVAEWLETARMLGREIPVPRGRLAFA